MAGDQMQWQELSPLLNHLEMALAENHIQKEYVAAIAIEQFDRERIKEVREITEEVV